VVFIVSGLDPLEMGCASCCPNCVTILSIRAVWERDTVLLAWFHLIAIPMQNLGSPRLGVIHCVFICDSKRKFSSSELAMDRKSST